MSDEVQRIVYEEVAKQSQLRVNIPEAHRVSDDTRLAWLWNQRLSVVQSIYMGTKDLRDKMAATLVLSCTIGGGQLPSIELLLKRLEGGPESDEAVQEKDSQTNV